jgi:hypothetical protein
MSKMRSRIRLTPPPSSLSGWPSETIRQAFLFICASPGDDHGDAPPDSQMYGNPQRLLAKFPA